MISWGICRGCGKKMTKWFVSFRKQPIWLCRECKKK